uniref:Uncharacterized protein n=1 Tax=viral metagenome TaxID=1070528 RepID=A0A6H1ZKV8_9ZZZZ
MNIYEEIYNQKHLSNEQKQAVSTIIAEWDSYRECQREAMRSGKGMLTLRKLFYKDTGVMMPIMCNWKTKQELLDQFKII